jgi:hypothetical protein
MVPHPSIHRANVGALLKDGANAPCCSPALWGLLGRYYAAVGQLESAKEAVLKQVGHMLSRHTLMWSSRTQDDKSQLQLYISLTVTQT